MPRPQSRLLRRTCRANNRQSSGGCRDGTVVADWKTNRACHWSAEAYDPDVKEKWHRWLPYAFMLLAAVSRWPGLFPSNFSAFYALAFCAGAFFPGAGKWWLPLGTMVITDVLLNVVYYHESVLSLYMVIKLASFALLIGLGCLFTARTSWLKLLCGGLIGAVLFYLITNTASWLNNPEYAKTLAGWIQALTSGTPNYPPTWTFFRNTLLSGGLFTGLFAGAMKLTAPESAEEKDEEPAEEPEGEPAAEET
jgi:uncharacterized protein DUF6580